MKTMFTILTLALIDRDLFRVEGNQGIEGG